MISIVKALSKKANPDDILAISYRLQALAQLFHDEGKDVAGFSMTVDGKEYKLVNEAAFKAAAACLSRYRTRGLTSGLTAIDFCSWRFRSLRSKATDDRTDGADPRPVARKCPRRWRITWASGRRDGGPRREIASHRLIVIFSNRMLCGLSA